MNTRYRFWVAVSITIMIVLTGSSNLFSQYQNQYEYAVYLKNGGVVRGIIIEQIPGVHIKIQTKDRNIFVFKMKEILKITKEKIPGGYGRYDISKYSYTVEPAHAVLFSIIWPGGGYYYLKQWPRAILYNLLIPATFFGGAGLAVLGYYSTAVLTVLGSIVFIASPVLYIASIISAGMVAGRIKMQQLSHKYDDIKYYFSFKIRRDELLLSYNRRF